MIEPNYQLSMQYVSDGLRHVGVVSNKYFQHVQFWMAFLRRVQLQSSFGEYYEFDFQMSYFPHYSLMIWEYSRQ